MNDDRFRFFPYDAPARTYADLHTYLLDRLESARGVSIRTVKPEHVDNAEPLPPVSTLLLDVGFTVDETPYIAILGEQDGETIPFFRAAVDQLPRRKSETEWSALHRLAAHLTAWIDTGAMSYQPDV